MTCGRKVPVIPDSGFEILKDGSIGDWQVISWLPVVDFVGGFWIFSWYICSEF